MADLCIQSLYENNYDGDFLFITNLKEQILNKINFKNAPHFIDLEESNLFHSSANKLKIYLFDKLNEYEKVIFSDCDVLFLKNPNFLFDIITEDKVYMTKETDLMSHVLWGGSLITDEERNHIDSNRIFGMNAGIFGFKPNMAYVFKEVEDFMANNMEKSNVCLEQPFLNVHLYRKGLYSDEFSDEATAIGYHLNHYSGTAIHFTTDSGNYEKKYNKILDFKSKNTKNNNMTRENFQEIVKPYTMTSGERRNALYDSLEYIRVHNIQGDFVECGVWRGGNILGIAQYLYSHNMLDRKIWLYDTFEGMTSPEDVDIDMDGNKASDILGRPNVMANASLNEVKTNLMSTPFPQENIAYVVGDIVQTLDNINNVPNNIALLRLDTDWYQSTKKELDVLYPRLVDKGILIVDDYGHWKGSKKAVDEYFLNKNIQIEQIDYTGIKIIKNGNN